MERIQISLFNEFDIAYVSALSVKKSLTLMIIANELTPTRAQGGDEETGWDFTLLVIGTLWGISDHLLVACLLAAAYSRTS